MSALYVIAYLRPQEGKEEDLKRELEAIIPTVRQEAGCIRYDLHCNAKGDACFMFYEIWQDGAALAAHAASEHMAALENNIKDILSNPPDITTWRAVNVG